MINIIRNVKEAFMAYQTNPICLLTYWMSVTYLYCVMVEKREKKLVCFSMIVFLLIPLMANIFLAGMFYEREYSKLYYMTGMPVIIAAAVVRISDKMAQKKGKMITLCAVLGLASLLCFGGTTENITFHFENQKVSNDVCNVNEVLRENEVEGVCVLAPGEVCAQLRELNTDIRLFYGVDIIDNNLLFPEEEESRNLYEISRYLENNQWDIDAWASYGQACNIDCIIIKQQYNQESIMEQYGYFFEGETTEYVIYMK